MSHKPATHSYLTLGLLVSIAYFLPPFCYGEISVENLQCEYLTNPLGIDSITSRLTWKITDSEHTRGQKQTAYQVLVASSSDVLAQNKGDLWDSGSVTSGQSALIHYAGDPLTSGRDCFWKVRISDKDYKLSPWSVPAHFTMGLLQPGDWTGSWIKHPSALETDHIWFRKTFKLDAAPKSAFVYVASLGYHELYVNGLKADDRLLAPALSRLDKRVLYVTYDITSLLQPGQNCIGIWTGAGWTRFASFKTKSALRAQLNAQLVGGGTFGLGTDSTWRCQVSCSGDIGSYRFNDHGGEKVDARKFDSDWNLALLDDSRWLAAKEVPVTVTLSAQMVEPTRVIQTFPVQTVNAVGSTYKLDFGANFSGWIKLRMHAQSAGDQVMIQVSDGPAIQAFGQKSIYICKGGDENFQNRFNYEAGRYVTITGLRNKPQSEDATGLAIGSDLARVGHFSCSNALFNKIYETDLWTYRCATVEGYTQDCPHRERLGYGEENFATAWGCGLPNYEAGAFYIHDLRSWQDVQEPNGWINFVAPQNIRPWGGPLWSSAVMNIGWEAYKMYGDPEILANTYATDKAWVDFLGTNVSDGILQAYNKGGQFLGDWARPRDPADKSKGKEFGNTRESLLFNNCVYAMDLETLVDMAKVLEKTEDVANYSEKLDKLRPAIHAHFFLPGQNVYLDSRQVHLAFPLFTGVTPESLQPAVWANFQKEITETQPYLDMGSSGLPILLKFLIEDKEQNELLSDILSKTREPSYGYFLSCGETAWPEYWDDKCASRIHTCYTGIASWFMKGVAGIREDPERYGYQSFIVKPAPVGDLTFAEASTESLYGAIRTRWEKQNGGFQLKVSIPVNSTAKVYIPAKTANQVSEQKGPMTTANGITFLSMEGNYALYHVESGDYCFNVSP